MARASTRADDKNVEKLSDDLRRAIRDVLYHHRSMRTSHRKVAIRNEAAAKAQSRRIESAEGVSKAALAVALVARKMAWLSADSAKKARLEAARSEKVAKKAIQIAHNTMGKARDAIAESKRTRRAMQKLKHKLVVKKPASAMKEASASVGSST